MLKKSLAAFALSIAFSLSLSSCANNTDTTDTSGDMNVEESATGNESMTGEAAAPTIVELAQQNNQTQTLVAAVQAADLTETLNGPGPYTVFAPTDQAFSAVQSTVDELLQPQNKSRLQQVLTYHVVSGELRAADLTDGQQLTTLEGTTLTVRVSNGQVMIGDATVVTADVDASNGVVHVIDQVLVPAM
jgi:uncharacterized surface protein with fasciclin (FAS1) repeats